MGKDGNWLIGGVAGAALLPLALWLGLPFVLALPLALLAFGALVLLLAPRRPFEGLDVSALGRDKVAFARELLDDAAPAADRIAAAATKIGDAAVRKRVTHLAEISRDVFRKLEQTPGSAGAVKRFLSYYVPRAAELAEGYVALEDRRGPDTTRLNDVAGVLAKLEDAFVHYADSLIDSELGSLDIDLKLVQNSLKEDLGR